MQRADSLENTMVMGKIEGKRRRGQWRMKWLDGIQRLNGYEFEQTPGDSEGQGSLKRYNQWGRKESDMTDQLSLSFEGESIFNFMAAVTVYSDFGAQENKICHCFRFFPIYFP